MKKIITVLLLAAMMLGLCCPAAPAESSNEQTFYNAGDYVYILKEDGSAEITGYTGKDKKPEIPSELDGHTVTSIGARAFYEKPLTEAVIPETVKTLGSQCFAWCDKLQAATLPEGLESIGNCAFYSCKKLTKVNIPDSAIEIKDGLFAGCDALKEIALSPEHPVLEMTDGVLFDKTASALLWYPVSRKGKEYEVPEGTRRIAPDSLYNSKLVKITLPDSVEELPDGAFSNCKQLKTVNIPPKVTSANGIFKYCDKLESVIVDEGNETFESVDGVLFDKTTRSLLKYPLGKKDKTYTVPDGTAAIEANAFEDASLTGIILPDSIRFIGNNAFLFCKKLKEIILPEGIEELGNYPFQWCSGLTKVTLPASLVKINTNPFLRCEKLAEIAIAEDNPAIALENGCLVRKEDMALVCCPSGTKAKTLEFPAGIRKVEGSAFCDCAGIEEVVFGDGLEEIASSAFHLCKKLKRVVLPESVAEIDRTAFDLDKAANIVFVVAPGSYAENFCTSYGLKVEYAQ